MSSDDSRPTGDSTGPPATGTEGLLAVYDEALPAVYGYVIHRCTDRRIAEDVTSETFLAAMDSVRKRRDTEPTTPWLIGIARHKLADHWRRAQRTPEPMEELPEPPDDPWDAEVDRIVAHHVLGQLSPVHRAVLTLRYVDDLPVGDCAEILGRTVGATEALLTRAKRAFRAAYPQTHPQQSTRGGHA